VRLLEGAGAIAGGITGVTRFGISFAPSVAAFNGPLLTAVKNAFPDLTVNQMNRLSDNAYAANTLVAKQSSKVMVAFLPQAIFLDKKLMSLFWSNPIECFKAVDFRLAKPLVDGSFIQELPNLEFTLDGPTIAEPEMAKFHGAGFTSSGTVSGTHLNGAKLELKSPSTVTLTQGDTSESRIDFTMKSETSIEEGTPLVFAITKGEITKTRELTVTGQSPGPKLNSLSTSEGKQGETKAIILNGTGFIGKPEVQVDPDGPIKVKMGKASEQTETAITVTFDIAKDAPKREYKVRVRTPRGVTDTQSFTVK